MNDTLYSLATVAIPMIVAIVFHEVAHGRMARLLGDHTAQDMGRLSFNPLRHVDPVGTVFLPGMLALAHAPVFGWAKPVPVDVRGLPHPRRAMMLVGAAGPAMNFALAVVAALGLGVMARLAPGAGAVAQFVAANLVNFLAINLFLACFNLLPLPPFDGSHIVEGLLPRRAAQAYARLLKIYPDSESAAEASRRLPQERAAHDFERLERVVGVELHQRGRRTSTGVVGGLLLTLDQQHISEPSACQEIGERSAGDAGPDDDHLVLLAFGRHGLTSTGGSVYHGLVRRARSLSGQALLTVRLEDEVPSTLTGYGQEGSLWGTGCKR